MNSKNNNFKRLYESVVNEGAKKTKAPAKRRKKIKDLGSYQSDMYTSKMWIRPNGEVIPISQWHSGFIEDNAKKYGIKIKHTSDDIRLDGINAGWFRVNYQHRSGIITFEGKDKFFNKNIKDAIFLIVADNAHNIGQINVATMNDRYQIVKSGSSNVFNYDGMEKVEHIPYITESLMRRYKLTESLEDMKKRLL